MSPLDAYLYAKENGFDALKRIRMLRSVYELSLEDAQKISFKGDTGKNIEENSNGNVEEYKKILDDELGLSEDQFQTIVQFSGHPYFVPVNPLSTSLTRNGDRLALNQGQIPTCGPNLCVMVLDTACKPFNISALITPI